MCCIALVQCVLVLRCGSAGWCDILMQAEVLVLQPVFVFVFVQCQLSIG